MLSNYKLSIGFTNLNKSKPNLHNITFGLSFRIRNILIRFNENKLIPIIIVTVKVDGSTDVLQVTR